MVCTNVHSLIAYQQCMHEQLNIQSDFKLRRGGVITNLTIVHHQLRSLSSGLLQFSYGHNNVYQLSDLRYLYIMHGTLRHIENGALGLIERALEYFDLSNNELQHMPQNENEQFSNLMKLVLSNNQIHRLTISDIRVYNRLQQLDLSFNRLQYVDMLLINHLKNLKKLFLNSNMLRTLTNNITFPNNFHLKLSSNPLECDCRLRWLRNALNRVEYPIYHDEPQCEMPKALADKKMVTLRDEQFVCGPIISKPDLTMLSTTTGEVATLRCDVYSDPAPDVWWTFQNKIIGKIISTVNEPDIHAGSYTIRFSCLSSYSEQSSLTCLNKTTTLTISNIGTEHNGTYNCVAAIRNQGRSDNEYLSYELHVQRSSSLTDSSLVIWIIGIFLLLFLLIILLLCICWFIRCYRSNQQQAQRNKALLFDTNHHQNGVLLTNGNIYKEKNDEQHSFVTNGSYDPYDMIDSRSQLGPPMYSEVRMVDSTPLRSIGGGSMSSSIPLHDTATLMRRHHPHDPFYDSFKSDRQLYEQVYRPSPMEPVIVDEFEDEMIFPTGYEEDYEYREDIMKPNQAVDPRRQPKQQLTNHDRSDGTIILPSIPPQTSVTVNGNHTSHQKLILTPNTKQSHPIVNSLSFDSNYKFDRSESQYAGLVESQLYFRKKMETAPPVYSNVELICQGAEARLFRCLYFGRRAILKERFVKTYRHPDLDNAITLQRLKGELRLLTRAKQLGIHTPSIYHVDWARRAIVMEDLHEARTVKSVIDTLIQEQNTVKLEQLAQQIGTTIGRLHQAQIIHGDLTTSNMLLTENDQLYLIDFGLSAYIPNKTQMLEALAVDLYVLERAIICTHQKAKHFFSNILMAYKSSISDEKQRTLTINKYEEVRARGRKRSMVG
ncbi:unnamed protein product [Rotaria sordida]|uniref:non-specific serine/threonine protein kinase n=1 Tax=Rotaria sordida TaxID=392033 RepID=A0A819CTU8_9BILA|nr:unnamed protein product [Rotaria sordida]